MVSGSQQSPLKQRFRCLDALHASRQALFLLILWLIASLPVGCTDSKKKEAGRQELAQHVAEQLRVANTKAEAFDFDGANAILRDLADEVNKSPFADVATYDKLNADIEAVRRAVSDQETEFRRKMRAGWKAIGGKLVSPADQARALAEEKRQQEAERARQEREKARLAAEAQRRRDEAERAEREAEEARIASDPEALRERHSEAMAALMGQFPYVPIADWKGQKMQFLESSASLQRFGYHGFKGGQGEFGQPTYAETVGRIGTVVDVAYDGVVLYTISLRMDDNGQVYEATAYGESIDSVAPLADIEKARAIWKGKSLWTSRNELVTYDPRTETFGTVADSRYAHVRVIDVVPGWYNHQPVRFILELASGERGFLDCQLSGTNVSEILRREWEFAEHFFLEDPRRLFPYDERTWSAIQKGSVFIGMTPEQARLSWGDPKDVHRTTTAEGRREQWVYGLGTYLYFVNGRLDAIQN
ncbi:MAG: hypothetical protein PVJ57_20830 [Phycisphaerae bacterium]|jgi:hypothetical protein